MSYRYSGITKEGKTVNGTIEASSEEEAKRKLKNQGIFYKNISTHKRGQPKKVLNKERWMVLFLARLQKSCRHI